MNNVLDRLNKDYMQMNEMDQVLSMDGIYIYMVNKENYRMMSQFEFNWEERPLRSARICNTPIRTDVSYLTIISFLFLSIFFFHKYQAEESSNDFMLPNEEQDEEGEDKDDGEILSQSILSRSNRDVSIIWR